MTDSKIKMPPSIYNIKLPRKRSRKANNKELPLYNKQNEIKDRTEQTAVASASPSAFKAATPPTHICSGSH